jgi:hypothetical protein
MTVSGPWKSHEQRHSSSSFSIPPWPSRWKDLLAEILRTAAVLQASGSRTPTRQANNQVRLSLGTRIWKTRRDKSISDGPNRNPLLTLAPCTDLPTTFFGTFLLQPFRNICLTSFGPASARHEILTRRCRAVFSAQLSFATKFLNI